MTSKLTIDYSDTIFEGKRGLTATVKINKQLVMTMDAFKETGASNGELRSELDVAIANLLVKGYKYQTAGIAKRLWMSIWNG